MIKLKPCPFCGGHDLSERIATCAGEIIGVNLKCDMCGASVTRATEKEAIEAWNNRAVICDETEVYG